MSTYREELLSDDILLLVFQYLSIKERVKAESVSNRWKSLIRKSFSPVRRLRFELAIGNGDPKFEMRSAALRALLRRLGPNLDTLVLGETALCQQVYGATVQNVNSKFDFDHEFMRAIEENCSKLRELRLFRYSFDSVPLFQHLLNFAQQAGIRRLAFEYCRLDALNLYQGQECETALKKLFSHETSSLTSFVIYGRGSCYGHLLIDSQLCRALPTTLLHLNLSAGQSLRLYSLDFLEKLPNLRGLSLQRCDVGSDELAKLSKFCPNLEQLDLSYAKAVDDFSSIGLLKCLRKLILEGNRNNFSDEQLARIAAGCARPLTHLRLDYCAALSEFGLKSGLEKLANLRALSLNGLNSATNSLIYTMCRYNRELTSLELSSCRLVTETGLAQLVHLPKLQYLALYAVPSVSGRILDKLKDSESLQVIHAANWWWSSCAEPEHAGQQ